MLELARLGLEHLGPPSADDDIDTDALVLSLRASYKPVAGGDGACYQLEVEGEPFNVTVEGGGAQTARGQISQPRCTITSGARALARLLSGATDPDAAIASGELELSGPRRELDRFLQTFSYPSARRA